MKYTVRNAYGKAIKETDSFREAFFAADDGEGSSMIYNEFGARYTVDEAAEIVAFVNNLFINEPDGHFPMTAAEAMTNLIQMSEDGVETPRYITSEDLANCWNELVEEEANDPAKKEYLLKTVCEGIKQISIKTGKQIADIYEMDQIAGIYAHMEVWDVSGDHPVRISLLDLVNPILEQKRWMEQEYRDYCENEAYGDY